MEGKKYIIKIYLFMILICCVSCNKRAAPKIVSGKPAQISRFPYLVGIRDKNLDQYKFGTGHFCGGSLISSVKVISAAHCFAPSHPPPASKFLVVYGIDRLDDSQNAITSEVKKYKTHEKFEEPVTNDIAIVVLKTAVPANRPAIKPIKLPIREAKIGTKCQVAGFGTTKFGGSLSNQLLVAEVPIVAHDVCQRVMVGLPLHPAMLCAGGGGSTQSSCQGDSGGPLTCNNELVGIVSWGIRCGQSYIPSVYSNVYMYRDWINGFDERSKGVSIFRNNVISVYCAFLMSLFWYFIKK